MSKLKITALSTIALATALTISGCADTMSHKMGDGMHMDKSVDHKMNDGMMKSDSMVKDDGMMK